jgi:hypothetical protein
MPIEYCEKYRSIIVKYQYKIDEFMNNIKKKNVEYADVAVVPVVITTYDKPNIILYYNEEFNNLLNYKNNELLYADILQIRDDKLTNEKRIVNMTKDGVKFQHIFDIFDFSINDTKMKIGLTKETKKIV